jgi:pimeloyl-ACP methyl ester carboxylesterase
MRRQKPISILLLPAFLAAALSGCGIGGATNEQKISEAATTYLQALADGETAEACAQLTRRARGERCEQTMRDRLPRLDSDALQNAADGSMDIDVDGNRATAGLAEPEGARFLLAKIGDEWRIDSGYTLASSTAEIPATPVGQQITWGLAQLNGGAANLTEADVAARFSPEFLAVWMPASEIVAWLRKTATQHGPFTFAGFAYPPTATRAVALVETKAGKRASLRIEVDGGKHARILRFDVDDPPPTIEAAGPYAGHFEVGGRELFLHCTGSGNPTVVFQGGVTPDWVEVQSQVARFTRACSYDPANGLWGRSDPAATPRTAKDVVADLHALLAAAKVPRPYVLVGHSNGGLFVQLYASEHPDEVNGLVLLDAVHKDYYARRIALLKNLLPPAAFEQTVRGLRARLPAILDPEQIDVEASLEETRAALATSPLRAMPLFVLTRSRPDESSSDPRLAAADERLWRRLQTELAALVPKSKHVIAEQSGHDIHHEQPDLVVSAIRDVVEAVRDPATWKP